MGQCNRNRVVRNLMNIVRRAVQRINDPAVTLVQIDGPIIFFPEKGMIGKSA